ncbi:hypothetical protein KMW28_02075 [Flammeovirga yaeyamensis]|uniref:DUF5672 domain-containing protein n=1 Tax=Flammeovirga yaeyamensis TaxID=367791 RepID=A0AAX1N4B0_9BACT|nr:DUF5672 family protein [Flammeovirga yaeyamensis]MBB3701442.1 hypothetical protein [Flammeovirga yaeyamensis]NMF38526.1 hypothetical protein [Flammeovirga yaeyamensis]QWG02394.1 hypothetical protein KMW28_02075 [Flammeovirga yaeyamensis]
MNNNCVVVIPIYKKSLTDLEKISLQQGLKVLHQRDIFFIAPKGLDISYYQSVCQEDFNIKYFNKNYFQDIKGYNRLMVSEEFYSAFDAYKFMLIYQTDCFIFRDELDDWCNRNYSYVGAPWPENDGSNSIWFKYVGNGGFSLRKIDDHLKVLNETSSFTKTLFSFNGNRYSSWYALFRLRKNDWSVYKNSNKNEDMFFGKNSSKSFPYFTVPTPDEALDFGMELRAKEVFKYHNERLPMGIHAWWKDDFDLWKPYIEAEGYSF